jgi:DNA-directed RNA polymerase III subunit RPC1
MGVHNNLITPRNGEPLIASAQDFLTAAYLLTQKDQFFTKEKFCTLAAFCGDADEEIDVPMPAVVKPIPLWTGKQLFSSILCPNRNKRSSVSFEMKEKNYAAELKMKHFCPKDGYVAFRDGELITGNIAKKTIGNGSKTGLIYVLLRDCGEAHAAAFMDRFAKLCSRYMGFHKGLSIGISDVTPSEELQALKFDILSKGYDKVNLCNMLKNMATKESIR